MAPWETFVVLFLVHGNLFSEAFKYSSASKFTTDALPWNTYGSAPQDSATVHIHNITYKNGHLISEKVSEPATEKRGFFSKFASFFKPKNKKADEYSSGNVQQDEGYGKISKNNYGGFKTRGSNSENGHFRVTSPAAYNDNPDHMEKSEEYQDHESSDNTYEADDDIFEQDNDAYNNYKIRGYGNVGEDSSDHDTSGRAMTGAVTGHHKPTSKPRKIRYMHRIKVPVMQQTKKGRQRPPRFFKSMFKKIKALFSSKKDKNSHNSRKEESNIKESSSEETRKKTPKQESDMLKSNDDGHTKGQEPTTNFYPIYQSPIVHSEKGTEYLEQMDENPNEAMTQDLLPNEENYTDDETFSEGEEERHIHASDNGTDYPDGAKSLSEGILSDKIEYPDEVEYPSEDSYLDEVAIPSKQYPAEERSSVEGEVTEEENNLSENDKNVGNKGDHLDTSVYPEVDEYPDEVNIPGKDYTVEEGEANDLNIEGDISGGNEEHTNEIEYPEGDVYPNEIQDQIGYPTTEKNPDGEDYPTEVEYPTLNDHAREDYSKDDYSSEAKYSEDEDYQGKVANPEENYDASDIIIPRNEYQVGEENTGVKEKSAAEFISEIKNASEALMAGKLYPGTGHYGVKEDFPENKDQEEEKKDYINAVEFLKEKLMHVKKEEKLLEGILDYSNGQTHMGVNHFPENYANPSWPYALVGTKNEHPMPYAWPIPQNLPAYNGIVPPNYHMSQGPMPLYYPNQWQPLVYPAPLIGG